MNWISVEDRIPEDNHKVLVYGNLNTELSGLYQNKSIGVVYFESINISHCSDMCYYDLYYSDITHWMEISEPLPTSNSLTIEFI